AHAAGAFVLDVREPHEYEAGHVPGAVNIPLSQLPVRAQELGGHDRVYTVCGSGGRSFRGAEALARAGVTAVNVAGGTKAWQAAGRLTTSGTSP
ncbi:MAG TPA: rhodanese-like domain-containing protein, partial [Actinomycetales bacterium]|nr:rhodanese-like domain-containing protein [Actinomycetales bacterium]